MEIYKEFRFDAAHSLPNAPEDHKCRRLHGHTYTVVLYMRGDVDEKTGWLIDFGDISRVFKPIEKEYLDHHNLNETLGIDNTTSENIAIWIWKKLKPQLPLLSKVVVKETPSCGAVYSGE
jgi:6-pyruvoyltetrahydropterin/6-carboxytetrahydropterin synthase